MGKNHLLYVFEAHQYQIKYDNKCLMYAKVYSCGIISLHLSPLPLARGKSWPGFYNKQRPAVVCLDGSLNFPRLHKELVTTLTCAVQKNLDLPITGLCLVLNPTLDFLSEKN